MEHNINKLKEITNQSTWKFILLSAVTAGIYPLMWAWKNIDLFNEELGSKSLNYKIILSIAILNGIGKIFFPTNTEGVGVGIFIFFSFFSLAVFILWVVWSFKMKSALELYALTKFKFQLKLNVFYTFLFTIYYINYCMNSLEEDFKRNEAISQINYSKS